MMDNNKQDTTTNGKIILEFFPEEYIALQRELATGLHPVLETRLSRISVEEIDFKLAAIAQYCDIVLDGEYSLEDRMKLCALLTKKLIDKRVRPTGLIIIN